MKRPGRSVSAARRVIEIDEVLVDKNLFPIENIDLGVSDFAMNEQRDLVLLHRFKNRVQGFDRADAGV